MFKFRKKDGQINTYGIKEKVTGAVKAEASRYDLNRGPKKAPRKNLAAYAPKGKSRVAIPRLQVSNRTVGTVGAISIAPIQYSPSILEPTLMRVEVPEYFRRRK